jgi:hypothetical protein
MKNYKIAKSKVKKRVKSYKIIVWAALTFAVSIIILLIYNLIITL